MLKILKALTYFFSGAIIDKELEEFLESKGTLTPEQQDRYRKEFFSRKLNGRYF